MTTRETPAIDKIVQVTGVPEHRVYETLRTIKQFRRYAENDADDGGAFNIGYYAGFADGMADSLKFGSGINNLDIDQAIRELTL